MKRPEQLTRQELLNIVTDLQMMLWTEFEKRHGFEDAQVWQGEKNLGGADFISFVADTLDTYELRPGPEDEGKLAVGLPGGHKAHPPEVEDRQEALDAAEDIRRSYSLTEVDRDAIVEIIKRYVCPPSPEGRLGTAMRHILEWSRSRDGSPEADDKALREIESLCEGALDKMSGPNVECRPFVLTVFIDEGGRVDFHAAPAGEFEGMVWGVKQVLKKFHIFGHIEKETL